MQTNHNDFQKTSRLKTTRIRERQKVFFPNSPDLSCPPWTWIGSKRSTDEYQNLACPTTHLHASSDSYCTWCDVTVTLHVHSDVIFILRMPCSVTSSSLQQLMQRLLLEFILVLLLPYKSRFDASLKSYIDTVGSGNGTGRGREVLKTSMMINYTRSDATGFSNQLLLYSNYFYYNTLYTIFVKWFFEWFDICRTSSTCNLSEYLRNQNFLCYRKCDNFWTKHTKVFTLLVLVG